MSTYRKVPLSFFQAAGLAAYTGSVAPLMLNLDLVFGERAGVLPILFFLVLYVVSAVVSASIVLGYPAYLVLTGRFRDGAQILASTVGCLLALLLLLAIFFVLTPQNA